jgi:hypothetical protein
VLIQIIHDAAPSLAGKRVISKNRIRSPKHKNSLDKNGPRAPVKDLEKPLRKNPANVHFGVHPARCHEVLPSSYNTTPTIQNPARGIADTGV